MLKVSSSLEFATKIKTTTAYSYWLIKD
jgi:hypothetical protein